MVGELIISFKNENMYVYRFQTEKSSKYQKKIVINSFLKTINKSLAFHCLQTQIFLQITLLL